ncbi:MAG: M28 family peptidase [bacterium]
MSRLTSIRLSIVSLFLFTLAVPLFAQTSPSPDSAMACLKTLADPDLFAGRKTGMPTGDSSQAWIAKQYERWGLKPLIDGQILVPFPMLATREVRAEITMQDPRYGEIHLRLGEDFTACTNSGSATLTAPVSLVGHGISRPEKGWDDYGDTDVTGRIVVVFRGPPNSKEDWSGENQRSYLLGEAIRRGAVAVFFHQEEWPVNGAAINADAYSPTVPSGYIGDATLRLLLFDSGESVDSYQESIKEHPRAFNLDREMSIDFLFEPIENAIGYDVAGIVPGTDPKLKNEAVIVGGHGDHIGKNALGQVYPGADDNGSGTSVVMELARFYAAHPQKRTLIFCNFGGEEQGLLGSRALVPQLPKDFAYVTMLNLDMVGRGDGLTGFGGFDLTGEIWEPWFSTLPDSLKKLYNARRAWGGEASDHAPFRNAGIPAYTIWSSGEHPFYHRPDDNFQTIQPEAIAGTITTTSTWINEIANVEQPLADHHLAQRTVWHRGSSFVRVDASSSIDNDLDAAKKRALSGFLGTVLEFPYPVSANDHAAFITILAQQQKAVSNRDDILMGKDLKDVLSHAREALGTVIIGINGDQLSPSDTTRVLEWADEGLGMVCILDPPEWLEGDTITSDQKTMVQALKTGTVQVEFPLEAWDEAPAFLTSVGPQLYLICDLKQFDKTSDQKLDGIRSTGAKFILYLKKSEMKKAVKDVDRFDRFRVHVQPDDVSYEDALEWVSEGQTRGLEDKQLVDWLANHMNLW